MSLAFVPSQQKPKGPQPNQATIQKMLDENNQLIQTIADYQSKGKATECLQFQQILHRNLVYLATVADSNQNVQALLPAPGQMNSSNAGNMPPNQSNPMRPPSNQMPPGGPIPGSNQMPPGSGPNQGMPPSSQAGFNNSMSGPQAQGNTGYPRPNMVQPPIQGSAPSGLMNPGQGMGNQGNMPHYNPQGGYPNQQQPMMSQQQPMMSQPNQPMMSQSGGQMMNSQSGPQNSNMMGNRQMPPNAYRRPQGPGQQFNQQNYPPQQMGSQQSYNNPQGQGNFNQPQVYNQGSNMPPQGQYYPQGQSQQRFPHFNRQGNMPAGGNMPNNQMGGSGQLPGGGMQPMPQGQMGNQMPSQGQSGNFQYNQGQF
ncbi:hypothetical protein SNE40_008046 [Patella caerulea]|uniref:SS18 N-terminal domain-containing protein n=1 Tax=Patella caerulea TaxID=87958 RepID=A0AAN8JY18_PATCE